VRPTKTGGRPRSGLLLHLAPDRRLRAAGVEDLGAPVGEGAAGGGEAVGGDLSPRRRRRGGDEVPEAGVAVGGECDGLEGVAALDLVLAGGGSRIGAGDGLEVEVEVALVGEAEVALAVLRLLGIDALAVDGDDGAVHHELTQGAVVAVLLLGLEEDVTVGVVDELAVVLGFGRVLDRDEVAVGVVLAGGEAGVELEGDDRLAFARRMSVKRKVATPYPYFSAEIEVVGVPLC
jgi:hypothetical protein